MLMGPPWFSKASLRAEKYNLEVYLPAGQKVHPAPPGGLGNVCELHKSWQPNHRKHSQGGRTRTAPQDSPQVQGSPVTVPFTLTAIAGGVHALLRCPHAPRAPPGTFRGLPLLLPRPPGLLCPLVMTSRRLAPRGRCSCWLRQQLRNGVPFSSEFLLGALCTHRPPDT